jgi:hypothetical protein
MDSLLENGVGVGGEVSAREARVQTVPYDPK